MEDKNKEIHYSENTGKELEITEFDLSNFELTEDDKKEIQEKIIKKTKNKM